MDSRTAPPPPKSSLLHAAQDPLLGPQLSLLCNGQTDSLSLPLSLLRGSGEWWAYWHWTWALRGPTALSKW